MADTILLKHQSRTTLPRRLQYFYDGRAEVRFGIIELPVTKTAWIDRAFMLGFRLDPETGKPLELADIRRRALGQLVIETPEPEVGTESTKSAGEEDEKSSDTGRLPAGDDGLRESQQPSDEGISEPGVGSSVSDRADVKTSRRRPK